MNVNIFLNVPSHFATSRWPDKCIMVKVKAACSSEQFQCVIIVNNSWYSFEVANLKVEKVELYLVIYSE